MRNKVIAGLLILGAFLALVASGLLIFRAMYFASHTGSLLSASIGVALGVISLVLTFKSLDKAGQDAENKVNKIKLAKPLGTVILAFIGSLAAIHFAGMSVADYLQWLASALAIQHT